MRLELTRRADYAIRAMLLLAGSDGLISASRIADLTNIPPRFLPQVMADLVRARFVTALKGRHGGYTLTEAGREATVLDVVEAVEGDSRRRVCVLRGGPCRVDGRCEVHDVFASAQEALRSRLDAATITSLAGSGASTTGPAAGPSGAAE